MATKIFSNAIENWLLNYQDFFSRVNQHKKSDSTIQINDAAGKMAFIYEKIRNTVDYKDEHLLRKYAIARILKRMSTPGHKGIDIALPLIQELIRARYLINKEVPEEAVGKVKHIINKYIIIYNATVDKKIKPKELSNFFDWLINLAACEIEEVLIPTDGEGLTLWAMFRVIKQNIVIKGSYNLTESDKNIQIYIAILRSFIKADEMTVNHYLFKYYLPQWQDMNLKEINQQVDNIRNIKDIIADNYKYYLNEKLIHEFKKYTVVFWILQNIIYNHKNNFQQLFLNKDYLFEEIRKVCNKKYKNIRSKVRTSIIRSIIYIFLTKMVFGLLLEFPYDYFILHDIFWLPLAINALFPPALMAFIGFSIKTPKEDNTNAIIKETEKIVYNQSGGQHIIKFKKHKTGVSKIVGQILYFLLFLISFSLIIYTLNILNFSPASMAIFLVFLTLVSFFSMRIRSTATEYIIIEQRERFLTTIITLLFVPIIRVGRWISLHSSKVNVFIFIMDFIIETPFKIFVRIFEDLVVFVKEKRDEML